MKRVVNAWRRAKGPLALTLMCAFVGLAHFGLTALVGIAPSFVFQAHSLFWPLWFVVSGAVGLLAVAWVLSIHWSPPRCC